jgi:hypothetical protein
MPELATPPETADEQMSNGELSSTLLLLLKASDDPQDNELADYLIELSQTPAQQQFSAEAFADFYDLRGLLAKDTKAAKLEREKKRKARERKKRREESRYNPRPVDYEALRKRAERKEKDYKPGQRFRWPWKPMYKEWAVPHTRESGGVRDELTTDKTYWKQAPSTSHILSYHYQPMRGAIKLFVRFKPAKTGKWAGMIPEYEYVWSPRNKDEALGVFESLIHSNHPYSKVLLPRVIKGAVSYRPIALAGGDNTIEFSEGVDQVEGLILGWNDDGELVELKEGDAIAPGPPDEGDEPGEVEIDDDEDDTDTYDDPEIEPEPAVDSFSALPFAEELPAPVNIPTNQLLRDPDRFQWRQDEDGHTLLSRDPSPDKFDPTKAKPIIAWRDPENDLDFVVDGHETHERGERDGIPEMATQWIQAKDSDEAREIGRKMNQRPRRFSEDAQGHEHKGKGKGGGQFVKKGAGGSSGDGDNKTKNKPKESKPSRVPQKQMSEKALRAQASATRVDKEIQRYAEEHNEPAFAKAVGGLSFKDNEPVDVVVGEGGVIKHGIELKTMVSNKAGKITMKREAMDRKAKWEKSNKATFHTVVIDDHEVFNAKGDGQHDESKRKIFYRRGFGSFRVAGMYEVKDLNELKALLNTPNKQLPDAAKRTA